jgi:hypothetical protein
MEKRKTKTNANLQLQGGSAGDLTERWCGGPKMPLITPPRTTLHLENGIWLEREDWRWKRVERRQRLVFRES